MFARVFVVNPDIEKAEQLENKVRITNRIPSQAKNQQMWKGEE